ncbi:MAG: PAS domain S-box protein [Capsulimonas sp.]|uniref:PAS domain S-box protein n=1 Tax=Capsulimonas sp. TaxID=2494211 RepID=UPI0032639701
MNRLLTFPVFEDEEKTRRASMLNTMLLCIIALLILGTLTPLFAGGIARRIWLDGSAILILFAALILNRRGRLEGAAITFLGILWCSLTLGAFTAHGVHAPAVAAYTLVIACAGLLLGWRSLVFFTAISILSSVVMAFAEMHGRLLDTGVVHNPISLAGSDSMIFVMMALLMAIAMRSIQEALARARQEVDQRRASDLALMLSEERYRALAQNLPNGAVMLFDADLRFTLAAGAGLDDVGLAAAGLEGKTLWEALPPETCRLVEPVYRAALAGDSVVEEIPFLDRLYSVHAAPIRNASGEVTCGMVMTQDITARKRAEDAVRNSEEKFRRIFETMADAYIMAGMDGAIVSVNPALVKLLGYKSAEEIIGLNTGRDIYVHHHERSAVIAVLKSAGAVQSYPLQFRRKDGSVIFADCNIHFVYDDFGQPAAVEGTIRDITERKRFEEILQQSERRLALAQRITGAGVWDRDLQSNRLIWDDQMFEIYGVSSAQLMEYEQWRSLVAPENLAGVEAALEKSLESHGAEYYEFKIVRPDGAVRDIGSQRIVLRDDDGTAVRMIGVNQDITERKHSEESLRQYKDRLEDLVDQRTVELTAARNQAEAANHAKSVFLANMSHELRTPLNAVLGFSYLMLIAPDISPEQRKTLDIINRSGDHLLHLINDVLDVARIEAGREVVKPIDFDLESAIQDVTDMMRIRAEQKQLQLIVEQSDQAPRFVRTDQTKLRHILINLIGNAIKFSERGSVILRIDVAGDAKSHPMDLIFEVEDTGYGISPEDQASIFEPFFQAGTPTEQMGTGLGLTITKQFVELMGGSINVQSILGAGSCFRVTIPVAMGESAAIPATQKQLGRVIRVAPNQPNYRILIVEDQIANSTILQMLLGSAGFLTKVVEDGAQAIEQFRNWRPDFIWMDRRMPVMDGMEATKRIRAIEGGNDVRIVGLTASAFANEQDELLASGMDDCIGKPFRPNEIFECMARQLGVQYEYETAAPAPISPGVLSPEAIASLPEELKVELKNALLALDIGQIASIVQRIASQNAALGRTLQEHADAFAYTSMLQALQGKVGV